MAKTTSLISIIALLVGLCLHGSITVEAADSDDIKSVYPYWLWDASTNQLAISKTVYKHSYTYGSNGVALKDQNIGTNVTTTAGYYCWVGNASSDNDIVILQYFPDLETWTVLKPYISGSYEIGFGKISTSKPSSSSTKYTLYTNGHTPGSLSGYVNIFTFTTSLPSTMPEVTIGLGDIEGIVNEALNATTSATTEANTIQTNIYNTYNSYTTGEITEAEFNTAMAEYQTQLEELANRTTNTLADNIAINNAITYQDLIINQQVNNVSSELTELLKSSKTQMYSFQSYYQNGTYTQSQCIQGVRTEIRELADLLTSGQYTSAADIEAINAAINYGNTIIEGIANYADLDAKVSESANASMESEIAFVDSLLAETTQSLEQLTPQLTDSESIQALQWVGMIWENKFFKMVLPWCGIAMLLCLVLGVKYKT